MDFEEEKIAVIDLAGKFNPIEWPWNNLEITKMRESVNDLLLSLNDKSGDSCITKMMAIRELVIKELITIHGTQEYYDEQDEGKLTAILLSVDNFSLNQLKGTADDIYDLINTLNGEIYVPGWEAEDIENNIVDDIWYLLTYLEDWCDASGHSGWLDRSEE